MKNELTPLELREAADTHHYWLETYGVVVEIVSCIALGLCGDAAYHKLLADHYTYKWLKSVGAKSKN